ncbi:host attachment protein [Albimonas pacifica]|uniref:Protein required for attachment to host cells n=1 Tax=Albimonas pacifica TaxID=1114924 RepID=A0A1I3IWA2_9RHOB|nr:host attachment protein [Albimonas pacifica]SFI52155.1 Protein required for attachment to host cells [Albimonas pacifica]
MSADEWVLVMNSSRARVVRGLPREGSPALPELSMRAPNRRLGELMADKPGRSFASGAPGRRSAMDYGSDPLREHDRDFARQVIAMLEPHRAAGEFRALSIIAAPEMLGHLREAMPPALAAMVRRESDKNIAGVHDSVLLEAIRAELGAD